MHKKVLITAEIHPYIQQRFGALGYLVDNIPEINKNHLLDIIADYTVLVITTYTKVDKAVVDAATQLKIVGRVGSGMENVDVSYCKEKNIQCVNSPEGNGNAVGEHCLAMLLSLLNRITISNQELKNSLFLREENRGEELDGKVVGIIGYGHTGRAFAKKLRGFDVNILAYDKYIMPADDFVQAATLEDICQQADVISFHVPYNTETHHYCNADFIQQCSKPPVIINTSRGAVIDTLAVLHALENKLLRGLCIDVYEDEPVTKNTVHASEIYQRLLAFQNVIATPHIAGWTIESKYKLAKILMDKMEQLL